MYCNSWCSRYCRYNGLDWMWVGIHTVIVDWIGLDWVSQLVDWVGLDLAKWTHVQLCDVDQWAYSRRIRRESIMFTLLVDVSRNVHSALVEVDADVVEVFIFFKHELARVELLRHMIAYLLYTASTTLCYVWFPLFRYMLTAQTE